MRQRACASTLAPWLTRIVPGLTLGLGLVLTSCRVGPPPVTPAVVAFARASWPQATPWSLEQGRELFMERCARCHGLPRPASQAPRAWPALVDNMGNRAGMTREEKSVVLQYLAAASKAALEPDPTLEPDPSSPRPETETESSGY